jgi:ABC-type multidrug transport system fused ATPase/permease subunit
MTLIDLLVAFILVAGIVIISKDKVLMDFFVSWFKKLFLGLGVLYALIYGFDLVITGQNGFTLTNLIGLLLMAFFFSMLLTFLSKWKSKVKINKIDPTNESSTARSQNKFKEYLAEILIGGGVVLEAYNFAFKPWEKCSTNSNGGILPSFKSQLHCTDIQSSELLFISIVMIVAGLIVLSVRRRNQVK